ncbi:hypothetical protein [Agromyces ramosus]|uniref:Syndecan 1 n=1 Tax=Agromyces ramosus TaxID=33879 RepID=A0ABU0R672_9MICO|nr:hypothetical protein [Agromyces ramosus]MDQ0893585.1 hypothetical protein [Agromyces ramosus]
MSDTAGNPGDGTKKEGGLGSDGTIPSEPGTVGIGAGEPTTFEPEEDPDAAAQRDPEAPEGTDATAAPDASDAPDARPDGGLGAGPRPSGRSSESGTAQPSPDAARDRERDVDASS